MTEGYIINPMLIAMPIIIASFFLLAFRNYNPVKQIYNNIAKNQDSLWKGIFVFIAVIMMVHCYGFYIHSDFIKVHVWLFLYAIIVVPIPIVVLISATVHIITGRLDDIFGENDAVNS